MRGAVGLSQVFIHWYSTPGLLVENEKLRSASIGSAVRSNLLGTETE
jgi:hypothetical protein